MRLRDDHRWLTRLLVSKKGVREGVLCFDGLRRKRGLFAAIIRSCMPPEPTPLVLAALGAGSGRTMSWVLEEAHTLASKGPKRRPHRCNSLVGLVQQIVGLASGRLRCAYSEN